MITILKKISLGLLVVATTSSFSAQKIDAKAKIILESVATNYKTKNNVYFNYEMFTNPKVGISNLKSIVLLRSIGFAE